MATVVVQNLRKVFETPDRTVVAIDDISFAVADGGVGLGLGLDVGADTAVPQQVHRRLQDAPQQFRRRQAVFDEPVACHSGTTAVVSISTNAADSTSAATSTSAIAG